MTSTGQVSMISPIVDIRPVLTQLTPIECQGTPHKKRVDTGLETPTNTSPLRNSCY